MIWSQKESFSINRSWSLVKSRIWFRMWKVADTTWKMCAKNLTQQKGYAGTKDKLHGGRGGMDGLSHRAQKKLKIRNRVSQGQEEWNNFVKGERLLVLAWGDSNPGQSMTKIRFFTWGPLFQNTGELVLPAFKGCHQPRPYIHPSHGLKLVCQSWWCYMLSYKREVKLCCYLIILTFELLPQLYYWLEWRQNCSSVYCCPQEGEGLWNNCLYQHKGSSRLTLHAACFLLNTYFCNVSTKLYLHIPVLGSGNQF